jgi:hypothetical protein
MRDRERIDGESYHIHSARESATARRATRGPAHPRHSSSHKACESKIEKTPDGPCRPRVGRCSFCPTSRRKSVETVEKLQRSQTLHPEIDLIPTNQPTKAFKGIEEEEVHAPAQLRTRRTLGTSPPHLTKSARRARGAWTCSDVCGVRHW